MCESSRCFKHSLDAWHLLAYIVPGLLHELGDSTHFTGSNFRGWDENKPQFLRDGHQRKSNFGRT